jgi:integrase
MPVYKKGKNKWRVRLWHKGERRDWVVEGTKAEATKFEAAKRLELASGANRVAPPAEAPTFLDFCAGDYRLHAESHLKASTWSVRCYQIATLAEHFGDTALDAITTAQVEDFKRAQLRRGLKASTVNDQIKILAAVLAYARALGNPCATPLMIRLPERGRRGIRAWSEEQLQRLYQAAAELHPDILALIVFLGNTGCRRGEALALKWCNVDIGARLIRIWPSEEWQPKDGEPRLVPINDALLPWLNGKRESTEWVFPCPGTGGRYVYWPQRKFDECRKAAGLEGGPHTLRHTYATHLVRQTRDLLLVARILGHSHTRVTELYADILPDHLDVARAALSFACPVGPATVAATRKWGVRVKTVPATVPKAEKRTGAQR